MKKTENLFIKNLNNIPYSIDGHELKISKEFNTWVVCYESDFGYLKSKSDLYDKCIHSDVQLSKAIEDTLEWLKKYYISSLSQPF